MTSPSQKTYVEEDLPKIRAALPALGVLSDGEVEDLYRQFSEQMACASWLAGPETEGFRRWALLSPVQRLRSTKSDQDPPNVWVCLSSSDWATIHGSLHAMAHFFREFAKKTLAYRDRFLAMAADHQRVQSEMIAQQYPNHSTGWVEQPEHAQQPDYSSQRGGRTMNGTEPGTTVSDGKSNLEKLVLDLDHASKELLLVQHKLPQGPMRLAASAYACMAAHLRSGVEDLRQSLEGAGVSAALSTGTRAPSTSPGLVYFEELTREGNLLVPLGVRDQLELPTGGWLAFFPGTDGQIHVLSKRKYRERFGGGLDDG